jgi:Asp-tRNA(Asn)/Glu-tRNA(Gln) amidotransferase C subunit
MMNTLSDALFFNTLQAAQKSGKDWVIEKMEREIGNIRRVDSIVSVIRSIANDNKVTYEEKELEKLATSSDKICNFAQRCNKCTVTKSEKRAMALEISRELGKLRRLKK